MRSFVFRGSALLWDGVLIASLRALQVGVENA